MFCLFCNFGSQNEVTATEGSYLVKSEFQNIKSTINCWAGIAQSVERLPVLTLWGSGGMIGPGFETQNGYWTVPKYRSTNVYTSSYIRHRTVLCEVSSQSVKPVVRARPASTLSSRADKLVQ